MWRSYLKTALRNLQRNRVYAVINILGLGIGMACSILILLYIQSELAVDRWYEDHERIYRTKLESRIQGQETNAPVSPSGMAEWLPDEFEEVEVATRIHPIRQEIMFQRDEVQVYVQNVAHVDSHFFKVFSIPLISGNPERVLSKPRSCVISSSVALSFFGTEDPVGQMINYDNRWDYEVTGVMDELPGRGHFEFDIYLSNNSRSRSWIQNNYYTYFKLQPGADPDQLMTVVNTKLLELMRPEIEKFLRLSPEQYLEIGNSYKIGYQRLDDIHLHSQLDYELFPNGDGDNLFILALVGITVLLIAAINFMNLSTARSMKRSREVGIRKTVGAHRKHLISQFLSEALVQSFVGLLLSLLFIELALPYFNEMLATDLALWNSETSWLIPAYLLIALIVGMLSGSYPAFFLSSLKIAPVLRGMVGNVNFNLGLRKALVIVQFSISLVLAIGLIIIYEQIQFMNNKDLGLNEEMVISVPIQTDEFIANYYSYREELMKMEGIKGVTRTGVHMARMDFGSNVYHVEGEPNPVSLWQVQVDHDFVETMELTLIEGRSWNPEDFNDQQSVVINESAAEYLGWDDPLEHSLVNVGNKDSRNQMRIIGVVKDFHFQGFSEPVKPVVMSYSPKIWFLLIRVEPRLLDATLYELGEKWKVFEPSHPFRYTFLDDDFAELYSSDKRFGRIFLWFTILTLFIACLGLFGLSALTAEQKTKEIGIRKVIGASEGSLVLNLSKEFGRLILISIVLSWPLAWYIMSNWLTNYAFRIDLGSDPFILASALACLIAFGTISVQAVRAAWADPIKSLRYE
jgi:putative ABC transport system permease protein